MGVIANSKFRSLGEAQSQGKPTPQGLLCCSMCILGHFKARELQHVLFPLPADFAWGILLHHHGMENLEFLREWKLPCFRDVDSEERSFSLG